MQQHLTLDSELRARLYAAVSSFPQYKLLAEWLEVYQYILPSERRLISITITLSTSFTAYNLWQRLNHIDTLLTIEEQALSWTLIRESGIYPIPPF